MNIWVLFIKKFCVQIWIYISFCVHRIGYKSGSFQQYIYHIFQFFEFDSIEAAVSLKSNFHQRKQETLSPVDMVSKFVLAICISGIVGLALVSMVEAGIASGIVHKCSEWTFVGSGTSRTLTCNIDEQEEREYLGVCCEKRCCTPRGRSYTI